MLQRAVVSVATLKSAFCQVFRVIPVEEEEAENKGSQSAMGCVGRRVVNR